MYGTRMLSAFPGPKLRVSCSKCPITAKFDVQELLDAGGDRPLTALLDDIARRKGCKRVDDPGVNRYDKCQAIYTDMVELMRARGEL